MAQSGQSGGEDPAPVASSSSNERESSMLSQLPIEMQKLRQAIMEYVEANSLRNVFRGLHNSAEDFDKILGVQGLVIMHKMEAKERMEIFCYPLVHIVYDAANRAPQYRGEYEKVCDKIMLLCYEKGYLPLGELLHSIILTADLTLKTPINVTKWEFVEKHITQLEYKSIRNIFKVIIDHQLSNLPKMLTAEQRRQLDPIERTFLRVTDDKNSVIPLIFAMSEMTKGLVPNYLFSKLTLRLMQLMAYFRPIAELSYVWGRCFLFPIHSHPCFTPNNANYRIDASNSIINHRFPYLPYRIELQGPQTYLLYMIIRQPRGKEILPFIFNVNPRHKLQWEDLLSVLIAEAMDEVERLHNDKDMDDVPRYQFENIFSILVFGMTHQHIELSRILHLLISVLKRARYRRARDEVMWMMLQVVGTFSQQLTKDVIASIAELYSVLYPEEISFSIASDKSPRVARFLAAASIWIHLAQKDGLPEPTACLRQQIEFIQMRANDNPDEAMSAVILNAFKSDDRCARQILQRCINNVDNGPISNDDYGILPYGRHTTPRITPLSYHFIDALTVRAKCHLLNAAQQTFLSHFTGKPELQGRLPSPALVDSMMRLVFSMDFDFGAKGIISNVLMSSLRQLLNTPHGIGQPTSMPQELLKDQSFAMLDIVCYKLTGLLTTVGNSSLRTHLFITLNTALCSTITQQSPQLHGVMEQIIMRISTWIPFMEFTTFIQTFLCPKTVTPHLAAKGGGNRCYAALINNHQGADGFAYNICPEVQRMFIIAMMKTLKIMKLDITTESIRNPDLFEHITSAYPFPQSMWDLLPPEAVQRLQNMPVVEDDRGRLDALLHEVGSQFTQLQGLGHNFGEYIFQENRAHLILALAYQHLMTQPPMNDFYVPLLIYQVLYRMQAREHALAVNTLVDYIIAQCNSEHQNDFFDRMVMVLNAMVFHLSLITYDRLLLSLVMHPIGDHNSQLALLIIHYLCNNAGGIQDRIRFFCSPRKDSELFKRNAEFHKHFPEYTYNERMVRLNQQAQHQNMDMIMPQDHLPTYYGNLIERLLPITDFLLSRALELSQNIADDVFNTLVNTFAPIYKFHPCPISYAYTTLYCLHGKVGHQHRARTFVIKLFCSGAEGPSGSDKERTAFHYPFTDSFVQFNHQNAVMIDVVVEEMINRIVECTRFGLKPPPYASQDWRMAEYSPATQMLYLSCIELMASPHNPYIVVPALINILVAQNQPRPYMALNAIGLLLTALPDAYGNMLHEQFVYCIKHGYIDELPFEDIVFDNFEENSFLQVSNRELVTNAVCQVYWNHANLSSLGRFYSFFINDVLPIVKSEKELWYALRLAVPLLHRWSDSSREKVKFLDESLKLIITLYNKIAELCECFGDLERGDILCDLLYNFKYMFVGDFIRNESEMAFARFSKRMRDKLQFFITPAQKGAEGEAHGGGPLTAKLSSASVAGPPGSVAPMQAYAER